MAGRTSSSIGVGVTITVLAIATLGLFVATAIFFGKYSSAQQTIRQLQSDTDQYITSAERSQEDVRAALQAAKSSKKSLVGYLVSGTQQTMQRVTGARGDTFAQMSEKLARVPGAESRSLMGVIAERDGRITALQGQLEAAEAARNTALADLKAENDRLKGIQARHAETLDSLNGEIGKLRDEVNQYRTGVADAQSSMDRRVDTVRQSARERETELLGKISKLEEQTLILSEQLASLRRTQSSQVLKGKDEFALVDGEVIGINPATNEVIINRGGRQKAQLGMTFAVYSDANAIQVDPASGEYRRGKATIEIISVSDDTSTCRILSDTRGVPVVRGDVVANAVYDANKIYKFVVFGNFDTNGDGAATPQERIEIAALVSAWGGETTDDLSGDTDFLVLGERPVLPPKPDVNAPREILEQYLRLERDMLRYEELYKAAAATSVPILNQNRFYTLIGKTPVAPR